VTEVHRSARRLRTGSLKEGKGTQLSAQNKTTIELVGRTTPERLLDTIRRQAPHLLDEPPAPSHAGRRVPEAEALLTPAEVATMFRVDPNTVTRWARAGKLTSIRTLGGHRRYRETEVRSLLAGIPLTRSE